MNPLLLLLLPLAYGATIDVNAGHTVETNIFVEANISNTDWVGIYGFIESTLQKRSWLYYSTPFATIINVEPPNEVKVAELNLFNVLTYTVGRWYVITSPSSDVNLYDLNDACDDNIDVLLDGNFTPETLPSKTFEENIIITVNDKNICVYKAITYFGKTIYVAEWNGYPVYLSPIESFTFDGNTYNFALLMVVEPQFYLYLARENITCGDYVCDPGEEIACGDCLNIEINVSPAIQEVNLGTTAIYTVTVSNNTPREYFITLDLKDILAPGSFSYSFSEQNLTLPANSSISTSVSIAASEGGTYSFKIEGNVNGFIIESNAFVLSVRAPTTEENAAPPPEVAPPPELNLPEENQTIILTPRGYYIPWMGCISYIHVFSPDAAEVSVGGEVNVSVIVQNAGTCEENIEFNVEGFPSVSVSKSNFTLPKRTAETIVVTFKGEKRGVYEVLFKATGFYTSTRKMMVRVVGEGVIERGCTSKLMFMSPDVVEIVEGEDINVAAEIRNEGTCIEEISIELTKDVAGAPVIIDRKTIKLPPGEGYVYKPPRLATGDYTLYLSSGELEDTVNIVVRPRAVITGVAEELLLRSRFAVLLLLIVVLLAAVSYLRSRYFAS